MVINIISAYLVYRYRVLDLHVLTGGDTRLPVEELRDLTEVVTSPDRVGQQQDVAALSEVIGVLQHFTRRGLQPAIANTQMDCGLSNTDK